ncbi:MAG: hypothetical protein M0R77_00235 [Gammaproteobacteria bacterium]|nr:hypothetical protein [Acholeplasmataceae bacterium]MCK9528982.1 hypothetical protein [Gammaproteobacteria bacterium]
MDYRTKLAVEYIEDKINKLLFTTDPDLFLYQDQGFAIMQQWDSDTVSGYEPTNRFYVWVIAERKRVSAEDSLQNTIKQFIEVIESQHETSLN